MDDFDLSSKTTSRRTLLAASAWATPVVAVVAAAPAHATGSLPTATPTVTGAILISFSRRGPVWAESRVRFLGLGTGFVVGDTAAGDTLTSVAITFYVSGPATGLTWSGTNGAWTAPVASGTTTINGQSVAAYTTYYSGAPVAADGLTIVPTDFDWTSTWFDHPDTALVGFRRQVTVNGKPVESLFTSNHAVPASPAAGRSAKQAKAADSDDDVVTNTAKE